ncbi:unnamed protein product, partial [Lymnaea stagnalis]
MSGLGGDRSPGIIDCAVAKAGGNGSGGGSGKSESGVGGSDINGMHMSPSSGHGGDVGHFLSSRLPRGGSPTSSVGDLESACSIQGQGQIRPQSGMRLPQHEPVGALQGIKAESPN